MVQNCIIKIREAYLAVIDDIAEVIHEIVFKDSCINPSYFQEVARHELVEAARVIEFPEKVVEPVLNLNWRQ